MKATIKNMTKEEKEAFLQELRGQEDELHKRIMISIKGPFNFNFNLVVSVTKNESNIVI